MAQTFRLCQLVQKVLGATPNVEIDLLDLALLTAEYGRFILPAKRVCRLPCPCVIGRAPAIRTTPWDKFRTG